MFHTNSMSRISMQRFLIHVLSIEIDHKNVNLFGNMKLKQRTETKKFQQLI